MPRPKLLRTRVFPYHVYARSNNREWFYLPPEEMWEVFRDVLGVVIDTYGIQVHIFVMMTNHFHAVLTTPNANLDEVMLYLMREVAREVNRRTGRINHVFGGPYRWSMIRSRPHYRSIFRYVARNPVEAGLVNRVEDYQFSSLRRGSVPVSPSVFERAFNSGPQVSESLEWLNQAEGRDVRAYIKNGLRWSKFRFRTSNIPVAIKRRLEIHEK